MKVNDIVSGVALLLFAISLWIAADGLANPAKQVYGPAFFPKNIAVAMGIAAAVLIATSMPQIKARKFVKIDEWLRDPVIIFQFLIIPAVVLFYVYSVDFFGFLLAALLLLLAIMLAWRVRFIIAVPVSIVTVGLVHATFDLLLRVPLPRGSLFY